MRTPCIFFLILVLATFVFLYRYKKKAFLAIVIVIGVMWLVGILVALAVGFGMTSKALVIPWIPAIITIIAGWIVVIVTIIGAIMAIYGHFK